MFLSGLLPVALDYCSNTCVHGLSYLVNTRHAWEKVYWAVAMVTAITGGLYFTGDLTAKEV